MKRLIFDFSTIFGGKVGIEYIDVAGIDDDGFKHAIIADLLFVRITLVWGQVEE